MFSGEKEVYIELAEQYELYIQEGILRPGERLPSVRALASELNLSPNTVQKAYALLEACGLLRCLPKKGSFVFSESYEKNGGENPKNQIFAALFELRGKGISKEEIESAVAEIFSE